MLIGGWARGRRLTSDMISGLVVLWLIFFDCLMWFLVLLRLESLTFLIAVRGCDACVSYKEATALGSEPSQMLPLTTAKSKDLK